MQLNIGSGILFLLTLGFVSSTALTVSLQPHETLCYYVLTVAKDSSIGFYFAVQSGGSFDIDFKVKDPEDKVLISGEKERQGDWTLKAETPGEYEFCFANGMSTWADKVVDFEIRVDDDFRAELPEVKKVSTGEKEPVDGMVFSVSSIEDKLNNMLRTLQYYKTRNSRNQHTVKSTEERILWFSLLEILLMCGLALFQISVVHFFFKGSRKQMV
ncbi:Erp3 protein [Saccharomycopsis crataegensis]|uniref:Erp3 protein n=1 Tax=Saccharomycopsis crataegensis TaxID=43959 RepID=A0AAV5QEF9_9ASCO|nr:Erp3 protein [Saccharomycopsis crataegensis]